jgi:hypothetical protein
LIVDAVGGGGRVLGDDPVTSAVRTLNCINLVSFYSFHYASILLSNKYIFNTSI